MISPNIQSLLSGGIITNYFCVSSCRHCLYCCGPNREKKYINRKTAERICGKIKKLGCGRVHIGGGEPFLDTDGLETVLNVCAEDRLGVEYVETSAGWCTDWEKTKYTLQRMKNAGLNRLLVSMSPFHNEHIPFARVKHLVRSCGEIGIGVMPWKETFIPEMEALGPDTVHSLEELEENFGPGYLAGIPGRYWIHPGGRALECFDEVLPGKDPESLCAQEKTPCRELEDTSHFHMDLYENYIPGLCAGLAWEMGDLGRPLPKDKYPLSTLLYEKGIAGLFNWAVGEKGIAAQKKYIHKCHLCTDIRRHLAIREEGAWKELSPKGFYKNLFAA